MRRCVDVVLAASGLVMLWPLFLLIGILIKLSSPGPILYWSDRVGRRNVVFGMPKFRTMRIETPVVASHLLPDPGSHLTPVGGLLRRLSLDELPQLISIVKGDLTLVGPRPALYNQHDLIELRTSKGIHALVPGLTGWAQVNGRDTLSIEAKVKFDEEYLERRSLALDLKILFLTALRVVRRDGVTH